jgi:hypothetical protein
MIRTKFFVLTLPVLAFLGWGAWHVVETENLTRSPRAEQLLREIHHGLRPELAKLLFVVEHYRDSNFKVSYDGAEHPINSAVAQARAYLARNYHGERAEIWIKKYLFRSPTQGEVIVLKSPEGRERPLRDALLDDLRKLPV